MSTLGTAYVQIVPSARGISGSIQRVLNPEASAAGTAAGTKISGKIKGALAAAGIGAALGLGISKSIKEGAHLEQAIGGIETLFKDSADEMIKNADNAFKTAGISANTYMEQATSFSASLLQSTGGDTKKAAEVANQAIIDMSDNANKMGSNIQDIQNAYQGFAKQNYTMLDNLKLGYGGTKAEMERLLADAEKVTGKKYDISNLSDVYEAIHVMQTELDITGTTSKEAASTLSGSFESMKAAASNFLGDLALGRNVGPAMAGLAETAATFLFDNLLPAVGRIFKSLPEAISTLITTGLPKFIQSGAKIVKGLITGIQTTGPKLIAKLPQMVQSALDTITQRLPKFLEKGGQMITSLVSGIVKNIPKYISAIAAIVRKLPEFLQNNLPVIAQKAGLLIGHLAKTLLSNLPKIIAAAAKLGISIVSGIFKSIPTILKAGATLVLNFAKGIGGAALSAVKKAARKVINALLTPIKAAKTAISNVINKIKDIFNFSGLKEKVKKIWDGVKAKITAPIESAKKTIKGIISKIKDFFPIDVGKLITFTLPKIGKNYKKSKAKGGGSLGQYSFSVDWDKYAVGAIFPHPTLLPGIDGSVNQIAERGTGGEAVLPLNTLWNQMDKRFGNERKTVVINNTFNIDGARDPEAYVEEIVDLIEREVRSA